MRSNPMTRILIGAAALLLVTSSAATAQAPTPPPPQYAESGPLETTLLTSDLDDAGMNALIEQTVGDFHALIGGKPKNWNPLPPQRSTERVTEALLQASLDDPSLVVVSGGDGDANVNIARSYQAAARPIYIDLGQPMPCVTEEGQLDPSGTCAGGEFGIPYTYTAIDFAVEDGAYLAGLLAAEASRNDQLGIISGTPDCIECNRYVHGFVNGARSIDPAIDIELAYLAQDEQDAFGDPVSAKAFTKAFIDVYQPDVLLPVGRGVTTAMIEAACDAGDVLTVGTGTDVATTHPELADCVLTSVSKDVAKAVREVMYKFAERQTPRFVEYGLVDGGIAVSWPRQSLPVETAERYKQAEADILTGALDTCPEDCSLPLDLSGGVASSEPEAGADTAG